MKRRLPRLTALLTVATLCIVALTGCDGDDYWWSDPPYGWSTVDDPRLDGYWMLVQYNSEPVGPAEANYMYFNGNGFGYYYYLDNGYQERERLRYWCQGSVSGASRFQINIQYEYDSPITTSYWFTHGDNTLWLQWQTSGGRVQTYVYDRVRSAPW